MVKSGPKPSTHCRRGHEYTDDNTYVYYSTRYAAGSNRRCKACQKVAQRRLTGASGNACDFNATKTHCPLKHPLEGDNLIVQVRKRWSKRRGEWATTTHRRCRECVKGYGSAKSRMRRRLGQQAPYPQWAAQKEGDSRG